MSSVQQATTTTTQGFTKQPEMKVDHSDPFAAQRDGAADPFGSNTEAQSRNNELKVEESSQGDEWDASKTPPSRFQQRKGSIYATPGSRDGHVDRNSDRDAKYHEKLLEKGWGKKDRRGSKSSQ